MTLALNSLDNEFSISALTCSPPKGFAAEVEQIADESIQGLPSEL